MQAIRQVSIKEYKLPPTQDIERQVLADALASPECIGELMHYLTVEAFTGDKRPRLWNTITSLFGKGEQVDFITLHAHEGDAFIDEIVTPCLQGATARGAINHALVLRDAAARRRAYFAATKMLAESVKSENTENDLCAIAEGIGREVQGASGIVSEMPITAVMDSINEGMAERRELAKTGKLYRIPTGFPTLDWNTYKGWGPGQLVILAARPSVGKTAIMLQMARSAAEAGFPTNIFSLEMTCEELGQRMVFSTEKVTPGEVASGNVIQADFDAAAATFRGLPLYINDHSRSVEEIIARMTLNARAGRCRIAFIDYLGLMDIATGWKESLNQAIAKITGELKATAKRLKIPIVLLCQMNRESAKGDRAPELYDLRDSGAIEQDADIVMMLETCSAIEPETGLRDINIWLRKNRQYKKDICVTVRPNKTYSHFTEVGAGDTDLPDDNEQKTLFDQ